MPSADRTRLCALAGALACASIALTGWVTPARAQTYPAVQDRDYAIDLHQSAVLGSVRIIGMGGAATAMAEGSAGMLANPAAPAMRPATSSDTWDWDWHADWLAPGLGSDFDNSGYTADEEFLIAPLITAGVVVQYRRWAVGLAANFLQRKLMLPTEPGGDDRWVLPVFAVARLIVARSFGELTVGVGLRTGSFKMIYETDSGGGETTLTRTDLFELTGAALEMGAVWHPADLDVRAGVSSSLPVATRDLEVNNCDPLNCGGFILPRAVHVPWRIAVGAAWRRASTRWNQKVPGPFRDERYLLLSADMVLLGGVEDGHTFEGFIREQLQPSGQNIGISGRVGAEYEWLPGRLRVRAGSYWEPARAADTSGRLHVTLGGDLRVYSFCLWGDRYRARLSLTTDIAERYGNTGVSLGLWH